LEQFFGQTLGNAIVNLKPVGIQTNQKPTLTQSFKRHLVAPIDLFVLFGLVGYLTIKNTDKNQRLGDLWAKTIVIDEVTQ
jgi:uncharacterized RDD family membrane protein YckC